MVNKDKFIVSYDFINMGSVVADSLDDEKLKPQKNWFFLDVGNSLEEGIIDHHQNISGVIVAGKTYRSAASLLAHSRNLIMKNYNSDINEIKIIVHKEPDFDCFVSAYLAEYLLKNDGRLPDNYEEVLEYTEKVDAGMLRIEDKNVKTPAMVACALAETPEIKCFSGDEKNLAIMKKGLRLIDYIFNRLTEIQSIHHPRLFDKDSGFESELNLLAEDYLNYCSDLEKADLCEKIRIKLPVIGAEEQRLQEVDGLVFKDEPSCILHKYWARQDHNSPSRTGYIFTLIPQHRKEEAQDCYKYIYSEGKRTEERMQLGSDGQGVKVYRSIISVDPSRGVCLKGLAEQLELEELKKEQLLLGEAKRERRDFTTRRFNEPWCTNRDPWYDGRNHFYTIVDSPGVNSLLTFEQIKSIALNFICPKVTDTRIKYVFPFTFDPEKYNQLCGYIADNFDLVSEDREVIAKRQDFFLPYVYDYYNCPEEGKLPKHCQHFLLKKKGIFDFDKADCLVTLQPQSSEETRDLLAKYDNELKIYGESLKSKISVFRYGIGFFITELKIENEVLYIKDLLKLNKEIINDQESKKNDMYLRIVDFYFSQLYSTNRFNIKLSQPLVYSTITIPAEDYYESEKKELVYKLSNSIEWNENVLSNYIPDQTLMEVTDHCIFGFGKTGGTLLQIDTKINDFKKSEFRNLFETIFFDIFIYVLHQRKSLMNFAYILSVYDNKRQLTKITKLRELFMNFTIQGWYSQVTNNELGMEMYRHWQEMFENEKLYQEVSEQLGSVDDYNKSVWSNLFGVLSLITFPLLILSVFLDSGFLKIRTLFDFSNNIWPWNIFAVVIVIYFLGLLVYKGTYRNIK